MILRMAGAPQPTIYAAPTALAKTASSSTTIDIAWTGNTYPVEIYKNGVLTHSNIAGAAATYQFTGLSAGTVYSIRVRYKGVDKAGGPNYSPWTAPVSMATSLPAPNTPSTSVSLRDVTVTWTNSAADVPLRIYRDAGFLAELPGNTTSYLDAGLGDGTYAYTLKYFLDPDLSSASSPGSAVVAANVNVPTSPSASQVSGSDSSLALAWTVATAGSATKIYRDTTADPTTLVYTTGADAASWTDTGRTKNTLYHYRLIATKSGIDSSYTSDFSATTHNSPDGPPTAITADVTYTDRVTLDWTDGDASAQVYIYRGTSPDPTVELANVAAGVQTYNDDTVTAGVTYYYRLRTFESTVYSGYTGPSGAAVVPSPNFVDKSMSGTVGQTDATMTWTIGAGPVGATVDRSAWNDGDGDTGTLDAGVTSPLTVPLGFTIRTKNPGVTHEVTIAPSLKMRNAATALVLTDTSFSVTVYKDNTA